MVCRRPECVVNVALHPTDTPQPAPPGKWPHQGICWDISCLSCDTHTPCFCSAQGFLWAAAAAPQVISSFLIARNQISPFYFSHLIVFLLLLLLYSMGSARWSEGPWRRRHLALVELDSCQCLTGNENGNGLGRQGTSFTVALPRVSSLMLGLDQCHSITLQWESRERNRNYCACEQRRKEYIHGSAVKSQQWAQHSSGTLQLPAPSCTPSETGLPDSSSGDSPGTLIKLQTWEMKDKFNYLLLILEENNTFIICLLLQRNFEPGLTANFQYMILKQNPYIWILQNAVRLTMLCSFNSSWSVMDQFSILSTCTGTLLQSQQEISVDPRRCWWHW